ncbi:hypothetical protein [Streptomyces cadmiisoli]|uniref:hypothetical protein n=1 Tax=Streptomyces cadmiisoli TaxID=2184053 RepID=UPI0013A6DB3C|nr:hypothetical protein [Streptomyces cadmiisoli]
MKTQLHRTAFAVPVGVLALLVSGCAETEKKSTGSDRAATQESSSAGTQESTGEKPPTSAQLSTMLLQPGELDGYDIKASDSAKVTKAYRGDTSGFVTSDKPECTPLAGMLAALPGKDAVGAAGTTGVAGAPEKEELDSPPALDEAMEDGFDALGKMRMDVLSLSSYAGEAGAKEERDAVSKAARSCAGGFEITMSKEGAEAFQPEAAGSMETMPISSVTKVPTKWGDDASAWRLEISEQGMSMFLTVAAVQKGPVLVKTNSVVFDFSGKGKGRLPEEAIEAQLGKLK